MPELPPASDADVQIHLPSNSSLVLTSAQRDVTGLGGGLWGVGASTNATETEPINIDEHEAALRHVRVGDAQTGNSDTVLSAPSRYELTAFNGQPLGQLSTALDSRCQTAVAESLSRLSADEPAPLYADPLTGVRLAPLNGTRDVRFVYFIGVGDRPHAHLIVARLIYALYSPTHLFLIHVDVKAAAEAVAACDGLAAQHANVVVLRARRLVQWGMWTMVATGLDAMRTVLDARLHFDFFVNLSDADLALRTDAEMRAFFGRPSMRGRSLVNVHEGGGQQLRDAAAFINAHTVVECGGYGFVVVNHTRTSFPLTHDCCIGRSGPAAFGTLPMSTHELLAPAGAAHTGSQWAILSSELCRDLVLSPLGRRYRAAFERRLVPDESLLQTFVMHTGHKVRLINHNLRWIDWPHSHGDPNVYWHRLGHRQYVGGPKVLNASELAPVLASPYLFARKVDLKVDAEVLRLWDAWMAAKLRGEAPHPVQAPIGHSPGDPELSIRFRAPGLAVRERRRRRIARIDFVDGSSCGCGDGCDAIQGGTRDTRRTTRDTRRATRDARHATRDARRATRDTRDARRHMRRARHATRDASCHSALRYE